MRGARAFSWCPFKKHTSSTNNLSILRQKKKLNRPLAAFPPSVCLKEHQTKHTSFILTERLQYKKSLGRIFGAATPPGALVLLVGSRWCLSVCLSVCRCRAVVNGSLNLAARAIVLHAFLFHLTIQGAAKKFALQRQMNRARGARARLSTLSCCCYYFAKSPLKGGAKKNLYRDLLTKYYLSPSIIASIFIRIDSNIVSIKKYRT